ncbi:MAG: HD domain-containing protein [Gemmatimonadota bacterium]
MLVKPLAAHSELEKESTPPSGARARTVRDPLWRNIRLDATAASIVDTPEFQRLRGVKQLGFAHLVYPGAVHSRFLHALGVYHLTDRAISVLEAAGSLEVLAPAERRRIPLVRLAALLHDVGHYAFSHAMEEIGSGAIPGHHEEMAARFLSQGPIRERLAELDAAGPREVDALIRGESAHPLQGLVAGSLDLDKIDYLTRDSFFCGVPYGAVDVDRLIDALTLAAEARGARPEVAVSEKGVSALESLLFSKYQMFRNVYWHHAVRAATVTFRRLIERSQTAGLLGREELPGPADEELMHLLARRATGSGPRGPELSYVLRLIESLEHRRLPKRVVELYGDRLPGGLAGWISTRPEIVRRVERRLETEWGMAKGAVFLDYPAYPGMLELRILLVRRNGEVQRLTSAGEEGLIDLPRLSESLHHAARVFRVFCLEPVEEKDPAPLLELLEASGEEVLARLDEERALY